MSQNVKTPSRSRARAEAKTPLTPSILNGITSMALINTPVKPSKYPSHTGDVSNPFITAPRSRPASPVKRSSGGIVVSKSLARQASAGVIRKGGIESRIDVIKIPSDFVPPKPDLKRSKSSGSMRERLPGVDRFITNHEEDLASALTHISLSKSQPPSAQNPSPGHTARLAQATGIGLNRRVLSYHAPPPVTSHSNELDQQREYARPLFTRGGGIPGSSNGATTNKSRKIPTRPERVLDAVGMTDDFYLNLISWSCANIVAVALGAETYAWNGDTGSVTLVGRAPEGSYVSSVDFSNDGAYLGIGNGTGDVELWDHEVGQKLRTMSGHSAQIAALSWHEHILSSACADGSIWHHDVRAPRHKVMELLGHTGEVCGLKWRDDGELLASGGNDNVVNIWDGRVGDVGTEVSRGEAVWTKRNHTAAVKAIAWCPWQPSLLASGGGTNDATINIWNSTTGARLKTVRTPAQVTSVLWAKHKKELMSTHGYTNAIMVHAYPSMEQVAEIRDAHDQRILFSAMGPVGDVVCTGAGDENLKFWRIWEKPVATKTKKEGKDTQRLNSTSSAILAIR